MININDFIASFSLLFPLHHQLLPWEITGNLPALINEAIKFLGEEYTVTDGIAIHNSATIEPGAMLKPPVIVGEHCFIGSNAYLRDGVYLGSRVTIGTGCEIKASVIGDRSAIAHFNFIGNSVIGSGVNFEAGSVTANHYNEREHKQISVLYDAHVIDTGSIKFGALVGDRCRIGANAVLSPGTILTPGSIVRRLELVDQLSDASPGSAGY